MAFARVERMRAERREWDELLGQPVFRSTTFLPLVGGGALGPVADREGRVIKWGLWAPHRRLLVDLFPVTLPPDYELEDRARFAETNGLIYAVVQPGERLSVARVREVLTEDQGVGGRA